MKKKKSINKKTKREYETTDKYRKWQRKYKKKRRIDPKVKKKMHEYNISEKRKEYMRNYMRKYRKNKLNTAEISTKTQ